MLSKVSGIAVAVLVWMLVRAYMLEVMFDFIEEIV